MGRELQPPESIPVNPKIACIMKHGVPADTMAPKVDDPS